MKANKALVPMLTLLTQGASLLATDVATVINTRGENRTMSQLNLTSRENIESAWLLVPPGCKDRSFPYSPQKVENREAQPSLDLLFASFDKYIQS